MMVPLAVDRDEILTRFKNIPSDAHKGSQGHAVIIGGSYGKMGSVCLASKACIKSGAGLVTVYIPQCGYAIVQQNIPEVMVVTDDYQDHISEIALTFEPNAVGIGIGLGQHLDTQQALYRFLKRQSKPLVVDADALNCIAIHQNWLDLLPKESIITPHRKELSRIIGEWYSEEVKFEKIKALSYEYDVIVVVKGAPTLIVYQDLIFKNTTGNQGLATAGSGDVLTGVITGLLAQGYSSLNAALCGVYLHGLAADIGVVQTSYHAFIASDIIGFLGNAFKALESAK